MRPTRSAALHGTTRGTPTVTAAGGSFDCTSRTARTRARSIKVDRLRRGAATPPPRRSRSWRSPTSRRSSLLAADQSVERGLGRTVRPGLLHRSRRRQPWSGYGRLGRRLLPLTSFTATSTGTIAATTHTYADGPNDYTVTVDRDRRGRHLDHAKTFSVHVNNVAPSIAISGDANVNEGSAYSLTLGAVTDPGTDTVSSYVVHWGDGNRHLRHQRRQDAHLRRRPERLRRHGRPGRRGRHLPRPANALSVHVNNVAPTVDLSGAATVGTRATTTPTRSRSPIRASDTFTVDATATRLRHTATLDGTPTRPRRRQLRLHLPGRPGSTRRCDQGDRRRRRHRHRLEANVGRGGRQRRSVVTISGPARARTRARALLHLGAVTDPGTDTRDELVVHWGDGSATPSAPRRRRARSHTYADGPATTRVTVDGRRGTDSDAATPSRCT